jgi:hypothetical protein
VNFPLFIVSVDAEQAHGGGTTGMCLFGIHNAGELHRSIHRGISWLLIFCWNPCLSFP